MAATPDDDNENILQYSRAREAFIKKNYGIFQTGPKIWPKLWKILENLDYFMVSKSGLVLLKNIFISIMEFDISDPLPPNSRKFHDIFQGFPLKYLKGNIKSF